ncbi:MAG: hypothetical protein JRJ66_01440 [Deltaproteobacteria bacterium]|nr:hypothetical protein [Deltaproteobacteria bacterium]MBW2081691.1 hypothetical protein [Deltaproteobacteria bacterium]MBW2298886.1 hypothetical protein [Deltaproteobacteria bacterium]
MPEQSVFEVDGEELFECPARALDGEALEAIEDWSWMKRGFLPGAGGIDDQDEIDLVKIRLVAGAAERKDGGD